MIDIGHMLLVGRVVDQDVEVAELKYRLFDGLLAERAVGNVARYQDTLLAFRLDGAHGHLGVVMLIEVNDRHVGAFARVENGNCSANAAVTAGDEGNFTLQLLRAFVARSLVHRSRAYLAFKAWLGVMLRLELGRIFPRASLHGIRLFLTVVGRPSFERVDLALNLAALLLRGFGTLR